MTHDRVLFLFLGQLVKGVEGLVLMLISRNLIVINALCWLYRGWKRLFKVETRAWSPIALHFILRLTEVGRVRLPIGTIIVNLAACVQVVMRGCIMLKDGSGDDR